MSSKVIELNEVNFKKNINFKGLCLVDFWAPWCIPCQMMEPVINELSEEISSDTKVGKLNVDIYPDIANEYEIMGIPTLIIFKNGKVIDRITGLHSKESLKSILKEKGD